MTEREHQIAERKHGHAHDAAISVEARDAHEAARDAHRLAAVAAKAYAVADGVAFAASDLAIRQ